MRVGDAELVLDEVDRVLGLAEIVIVGSHSSQQSVRSNRSSSALGEVRHCSSMLPGTGSLASHLSKQRVVDVGELLELSPSDDT